MSDETLHDILSDFEDIMDTRGVLTRGWLTAAQWEQMQANYFATRSHVGTLTVLMAVILTCCFFAPSGMFWKALCGVSVIELYLGFKVGRGGFFLHQTKTKLRSLHREELNLLTSDIRQRGPGLMRTLQVWAHSGIPITKVDADILYATMKDMDTLGSEFTTDGIGLGPGQRGCEHQTDPYTADDVMLQMPWEGHVLITLAC